MAIKNYTPEQIVTILRQIEVQMANGKTAPQACKEAGWRLPQFSHDSFLSLHYTVLGRLLSLATPTPSPLDGRVF